jgi:AmmeMemoRadiSam system protein B
VASADLDHIGPRYGDGFTPHQGTISGALDKDRSLMDHLERLDLEAFVRDVAVDDDSRRICGFSPISAMLSSMDASSGRLLWLDHAVVDDRNSFVTFASMIFH